MLSCSHDFPTRQQSEQSVYQLPLMRCRLWSVSRSMTWRGLVTT